MKEKESERERGEREKEYTFEGSLKKNTISRLFSSSYRHHRCATSFLLNILNILKGLQMHYTLDLCKTCIPFAAILEISVFRLLNFIFSHLNINYLMHLVLDIEFNIQLHFAFVLQWHRRYYKCKIRYLLRR